MLLMNSSIKWSILLPSPERISYLLHNHYDHFLDNWWATFSVAATASLAALFFAVFISISAEKFRPINLLLKPIVAASQSFPLQAIAPMIIILLGVGFTTKTVIAFIIAFFPIYSACSTALQTTSKPLSSYLSICNGSFAKGMLYIKLPYALPAMISAAKVGFTLAVLGAVVAEFIQPDIGIGCLLLLAQSTFDVEVIYICLFLLIFQGLSIYGALSYFENKLIYQRGI